MPFASSSSSFDFFLGLSLFQNSGSGQFKTNYQKQTRKATKKFSVVSQKTQNKLEERVVRVAPVPVVAPSFLFFFLSLRLRSSFFFFHPSLVIYILSCITLFFQSLKSNYATSTTFGT